MASVNLIVCHSKSRMSRISPDFGKHAGAKHKKEKVQPMSNPNDRTVYHRDDGKWANKLNTSDRASSVHDTQDEANKAAAEMLRNSGGGERTTMGLDGRIVSKDTIAPGHESRVRDREH